MRSPISWFLLFIIAIVALLAGEPGSAQTLDLSGLYLPVPLSGDAVKPISVKKQDEPSAKASFDTRFGGAGNELNARIVTALRDLPLAAGAWFTTGEHVRRYLAGFALTPINGVVVNVSGQRVEESAQAALNFNSPAWLTTNSLSGSFETVSPIAGLSFVGGYDYWRSLKTQLADNSLMTINFDGAEGHRYAAGFNLAVNSFLSLRATGGQEQATRYSVDGFFGTFDLKATIDAWTFSAGYWTSPNFGNGLQVGLDYRFANGVTFGGFGGYQKSQTDKPYVGLKLSVPLTPPTDFKGSANLVGGLDQHMGRMVNTMPGVPISAKSSGAIQVKLKPITAFFRTVFGDACSSSTPTPGCTFDAQTGARITVDRDGDYNNTGHGSDDLWYVQFDASGNAAVYNDLGQFQYFADVSSFAGYISGTTIGVGTSGVYWENTASGTYWLGQNGVLYSANIGEVRYGQAVN